MNAVEKTMNKILNSALGIVLFITTMAAFYLPYEAEICPPVLMVLPYFRYICGGLIVIAFFILYASRLRVFRDNWYLFAALLFIGVFIYSTFINNADMQGALGKRGLTAIFALLNMAVFLRVNPKRYLLIAFFWYLLINIANTYCLFRFWGVGLWEEWGVYRSELISLVGNYNGGVEFVLPMAVCGSAYAHRYGKWLEYVNYAAMIMSLAMALKCDSLTQVAVFSAIMVFMIIGDISMITGIIAKTVRWILNPMVLVGVNALVYVFVIWLGRAEIFAKLGIDTGFHGRRHIWDMAIYYIQQKPLLGHGLEDVNTVAGKIYGYAHAHSFFLHAHYMTGIIGFLLIIAMLIVVIISWFRVRNDRVAYVMSFMMCCLCMTNLFEMYTVPFFVYTLGIIYYIGKTDSVLPNTKRR